MKRDIFKKGGHSHNRRLSKIITLNCVKTDGGTKCQILHNSGTRKVFDGKICYDVFFHVIPH